MGSTPLSVGFSRSMASIASSIELADGGLLGLGLEPVRPAGLFGNPEDVLGEVFVAVLGVGARASSAASAAWRSSKASEMYLRKMRPRTTCLYSAASMWPRSLSAAAQSLSSKPRLALEVALADFFAPARLPRRPESDRASLGAAGGGGAEEAGRPRRAGLTEEAEGPAGFPAGSPRTARSFLTGDRAGSGDAAFPLRDDGLSHSDLLGELSLGQSSRGAAITNPLHGLHGEIGFRSFKRPAGLGPAGPERWRSAGYVEVVGSRGDLSLKQSFLGDPRRDMARASLGQRSSEDSTKPSRLLGGPIRSQVLPGSWVGGKG